MPVYVDNTILTAVAGCDTRAVMRHVLDLTSPEDSALLKSGQDCHSAMEHFFKGGTAQEALAIFDAKYTDWATEHVPPGDRLEWLNVRRVLELWMEDHPLSSLPYRVPGNEFVEVGFQHPLDDNGDIILTGRMDAIVIDAEGDMAPLDHKFTGQISARWTKKFRVASQMTGYLWIASQHVGKTLHKAYINGIELSKLPVSERKCRLHSVPYNECQRMHRNEQLVMINRTDAQLEEWRKSAIHLAKRFIELKDRFSDPALLHNVRQQGTFNDGCSWCQFFEFCAAGRPSRVLDQLFVVQPWSPLDHAVGTEN